MSRSDPELSRRERQIMDALYRARQATAAEIRAALQDAPSDSAVRTILRILEEKGQVRHQEQAGRYVYFPVQPRIKARKMALMKVVETFFEGSPSQAVAALLGLSGGKLTDEELSRLEQLVKRARRQ